MQKRFWRGLLIFVAISALVATMSCKGCMKPVDVGPVGPAGSVSSDVKITQPAASDSGQTTTTSATDFTEADLEREKRLQAEQKKQAKWRMQREQFRNQDIYFAFDSADLSPEAMATLKTKADYLRKNPKDGVLIEGHCDERGSNEYNLALGDGRANSARNFLKDLGIDPSRLQTLSYGEENPLDPGHNEAAWAVNRRCHFVLE